MGIISGLFGCKKEKKDENFPPVPEWEPNILVPLDKVISTFSYYTNGKNDFVVFKHGTCVIIPDGLSDQEASTEANEIIAKIFNYHPDMNPAPMDDGNILIRYNHPAFNVALDEVTKEHMKEIKDNHQKALARSEVLMTPQGANKFDEFGMKALFGRCYFFMDAKKPEVFKIIKKKSEPMHSPNGETP